MDMEISPAAPTKITLATFGRGVYQADIVPSPFPPVTAFNYSGGTCTMPNTILFNDISTNSPTTWNWTVSPSTGVTITLPSSQNPTITFTNPGTYTVSLTASNGFGAGSLSTQSVSVGAPIIVVSASATTICTGQNTTLTASGGASYTWLPGGLSGPSVVVTPASSQTYTVVCTSANGCVGNTTIGITVSICTGIIGNNDAIKFNVYPNPANDILNINIGVDKITDFEFEMTNMFGQEVLRKEIQISPDKTEEQLNISSLANGIYFLKINSKEGNSQAIKIIKK